jgi:hypothetical protein
MKRKLLLLAAVLSLSFVVSAEASRNPPNPPVYIACETCMTTAPYVCQCGPNTFHPGAMSDCSAWFSVCY